MGRHRYRGETRLNPDSAVVPQLGLYARCAFRGQVDNLIKPRRILRRQATLSRNMLSKINKIKKLGLVFSDFSWTPAVPAFRAVNLVYGWNGCGKTTLTRLFSDDLLKTNPEVEYELETADGAQFGPESQFSMPTRIFNQDYIQKNVRIFAYMQSTLLRIANIVAMQFRSLASRSWPATLAKQIGR